MSRLKQWQLCSQLAAEAERIAGSIRAVLAGDDGPVDGWADVARDLIGVVADLERIEEHHDLLPEESPAVSAEAAPVAPPAVASAPDREAMTAPAAPPRASAATRPARAGNSGLPSSEAMETRRRMVRWLAQHGASKPSVIEQAVGGMPPRLRIGDALSHRWFERVGNMLWDLSPAGRTDAGLAPSAPPRKDEAAAPRVKASLEQRAIRLIGESGPQRTGRLVEGLGAPLEQVLAALESGLFEEQADGWHLSDAGAAEMRRLREEQAR